MSNSHLPVRVLVPLPLSLSFFSLLLSLLFSNSHSSIFFPSRIHLSVNLSTTCLSPSLLSFFWSRPWELTIWRTRRLKPATGSGSKSRMKGRSMWPFLARRAMGRTIWLLHWKQVGRYIHFQDSWIRTTGSSVAQQIFFRREAMSHGWTARSQKQTAGREFATSWVAWLAPPTSASSLMAGCGPYGGLACLGSALPSFSFSCSTRSHWPIILLPSLVCALLALFHVRKICFWACHRRRRLLSSIPAAALLELDGWGGSRLVRKSLKQAFFAFLYPVAVWRPAKSNLSTPVGKLPTFSQPSAAWPSALQRNFPWSALKRRKRS